LLESILGGGNFLGGGEGGINIPQMNIPQNPPKVTAWVAT